MLTTTAGATTRISGRSGPVPDSPRLTIAPPSVTATPAMRRLVDHQGRVIGRIEISRHFEGLGLGRPTVLLHRPG